MDKNKKLYHVFERERIKTPFTCKVKATEEGISLNPFVQKTLKKELLD